MKDPENSINRSYKRYFYSTELPGIVLILYTQILNNTDVVIQVTVNLFSGGRSA